MENVKGLFFDVGGTVFDWKNTVRENIEYLSNKHGQLIDSENFANDWRSEMFKIHTQVRFGNMPWINSDIMHLKALENLTGRYSLLSSVDKMELVRSTWHNLKAFSGAAEAVNRLRTKYTVMVLTILNWESIVKSSKKAGVQWDGILSCELLGYYKPSLMTYKKAAELNGYHPSEAMMVAAHEGDLAAAKSAGLHTAFVSVPETDNISNGFQEPVEIDFDINAPDFETLCQRLNV